MFVQTQAGLIASLVDIKDVLATTLSIHLFSNNYTPSNQSTIGAFTEADFTGYSAATTVGLAAASWQSQGAAVAWSDPQSIFNTASPYTVGQLVYGYYVESGTTPNYLVGSERFSAPITMSAAGDQIIISAPVSVADGGIPGQVY